MACLAVAALSIACNQKKEEPVAVVAAPDKDQIKTELQAMEDSYAQNMMAKTPEKIVYYADDAVSYSQNKPPMMGKEAILKGMKDDSAGAPKGMKVAFKTNDVFPSSDGNQVVEIGSYQVCDSTNVVKFSGNYFSVFEKKDGKYVCVRDIATSDKPDDKKK